MTYKPIMGASLDSGTKLITPFPILEQAQCVSWQKNRHSISFGIFCKKVSVYLCHPPSYLFA